MDFLTILKEEDTLCHEESLRIIGELRKKYSNDSIKDLDIIFNILCFSLCRLAELNVAPKDYNYFIQLVANIMQKKLMKKEE